MLQGGDARGRGLDAMLKLTRSPVVPGQEACAKHAVLCRAHGIYWRQPLNVPCPPTVTSALHARPHDTSTTGSLSPSMQWNGYNTGRSASPHWPCAFAPAAYTVPCDVRSSVWLDPVAAAAIDTPSGSDGTKSRCRSSFTASLSHGPPCVVPAAGDIPHWPSLLQPYMYASPFTERKTAWSDTHDEKTRCMRTLQTERRTCGVVRQ